MITYSFTSLQTSGRYRGNAFSVGSATESARTCLRPITFYMIPKHTNPYTLRGSTTTISRSALNDSDDEHEPVQSNPDHARMLARLESILKRAIDDVIPASPDSQKDSDGVPHKKKRKIAKESEKGEGQGDPIAVCTSLATAFPDVFQRRMVCF